MRIIRPSISSMTASVIGFERSSSASSLHAANQRSIQRDEADADRRPLRRYALMRTSIDNCEETFRFLDPSVGDAEVQRGAVGSSASASPVSASTRAAALARSSQVTTASGRNRTATSSKARNSPTSRRWSPASVT